MDLIKSRWRTITFATLVISYIVFIFIMDQRVDLLYGAGVVYIIVTTLLFLGTIVGIPGILLHSFLKKEKAAIPFYRLAIKLGTKNTNILAAYGLIQLRDYKPREALEVFLKAKQTTKHFLYIKTLTANSALCYWKLGDLEKAAKTYEDLFYYPDYEPITDFSLENLEEGSNKNHNFFAQDYTTMAYMFFLNNKLDQAEYFSKIALEKMNTYAPAFDNLGQIEYERGNIEEAKEYFDHALTHNPDMADSHFFLAKIALEEKDKENASKHINQINQTSINGLSTIDLGDIKSLSAAILKL